MLGAPVSRYEDVTACRSVAVRWVARKRRAVDTAVRTTGATRQHGGSSIAGAATGWSYDAAGSMTAQTRRETPS
eukprot:816275-Prymnesium_polylepis.1